MHLLQVYSVRVQPSGSCRTAGTPPAHSLISTLVQVCERLILLLHSRRRGCTQDVVEGATRRAALEPCFLILQERGQRLSGGVHRRAERPSTPLSCWFYLTAWSQSKGATGWRCRGSDSVVSFLRAWMFSWDIFFSVKIIFLNLFSSGLKQHFIYNLAIKNPLTWNPNDRKMLESFQKAWKCWSRSGSEVNLKKRGVSSVHPLVTWCSCWRTQVGGGRTAWWGLNWDLCRQTLRALQQLLASYTVPQMSSQHISITLLTFKGRVRSAPPPEHSCFTWSSWSAAGGRGVPMSVMQSYSGQ